MPFFNNYSHSKEITLDVKPSAEQETVAIPLVPLLRTQQTSIPDSAFLSGRKNVSVSLWSPASVAETLHLGHIVIPKGG